MEPDHWTSTPLRGRVAIPGRFDTHALPPLRIARKHAGFDVLRQLLGDAVDDGEERYGLNWRGKRAARSLALMPSTGTLRPAPDEVTPSE